MATKKAAPKKVTKPAKPASNVKVPEFFVAPDWGNVLVSPPILVPTGDAVIDEALGKLFAGDQSAAVTELAGRAPVSSLIAMFRGPALESVRVYWNDDVVDTLAPGPKRAQKKVYWAAESAKNAREWLLQWFSHALAKTTEGRAYLVELAAGDHPASMRGFAANALRASKPDRALLRSMADAIDPMHWVGAVDNDSSTWAGHTYIAGAMAWIALDPAAAYAHLAPSLQPAAVRDQKSEIRAAAVACALAYAINEFGVDPHACEMFTPALVPLVGLDSTRYAAMLGLKALPPHPAIADAAQRMLGATPADVVYWDTNAVALIATASDPKYLPWLARALSTSWMNWPPVFKGLANIGDPVGTAVIERWLETNAAPDRTAAATPILAALRARSGEPTAEHRATADQLLAPPPKKKRK